MDCPFCDKHVINNQVILETDSEYVLHNIRPATKGQCIVVPKVHVANIHDLSAEGAASLLKTVRIVSSKLNQNLKPEGFNYGFNESLIAGQSIEHLHFHIMPRYKNDGVPEFHLFHREAGRKKDLGSEELNRSVEELRNIFRR